MSHDGHTEDCLLVKLRLPSWKLLEKILFPTLHPHWPKKGLQGHKASEVRMWQTACHATTFLSASLLKDCVLLLPFFVFKWTLNDFDVSRGNTGHQGVDSGFYPVPRAYIKLESCCKQTRSHSHTRRTSSPNCPGPDLVPLTRCPANGNDEDEDEGKNVAVDDL
ncbi:hypothetical protein QQF64_001647 [Cirrhinus molitorella]|uniref:Uncharacterized protein n=1 Tax=Cirrhinus molitorella TaxID=172907 RepID=A0ABR3P134_9TELE